MNPDEAFLFTYSLHQGAELSHFPLILSWTLFSLPIHMGLNPSDFSWQPFLWL